MPFYNNVFYGSHPAGEPNDPAKQTSDPQLVNPGGTTTWWDVSAYFLQSTSPARGTGTVITQDGISNSGPHDYYGLPFVPGCVPDRGAHRATANCAMSTYGIQKASTGADGTTWVISTNNNIYSRTGSTWTQIPGQLASLDVGSATNAVGTAMWNYQAVWRWNGSSWTQLPNSNGVPQFYSTSAAADGSVWGMGFDGTIWTFNGSSWAKMAVPFIVRKMDVGKANDAVALSHERRLYRWNGNVWSEIDATAVGTIKEVSIAQDGTLWVTATDRFMWSWNGSTWTKMPGWLNDVEVGSATNAFGNNGNAWLWNWNGSSWTHIPTP